jgi:hypothetical protein
MMKQFVDMRACLRLQDRFEASRNDAIALLWLVCVRQSRFELNANTVSSWLIEGGDRVWQCTVT